MAFIVKQKTKYGQVNVHLAESYYIPEIKQPRQRRTHLGVLDPKTNELLLSSKMPEPDAALIKLLKKAGIKWTGRKADARGRKRKPEVVNESACDIPSGIEDVGELHVMLELSRESGLEDVLVQAFGNQIGKALLFSGVWQACTSAPFYLAHHWFESRQIPEDLKTFSFSSQHLSTFLEEIGMSQEKREQFYRSWIKQCGSPDSVIYDTTSISTFSDNLIGAEWGYNRDEEHLRQINLAMVVDSRNGMPLMSRVISGSIPDVKTLLTTSTCLEEYGLKEFLYVLDRGFFSRDNLRCMIRNKLKFIVGVPFSLKQAKEFRNQFRVDLNSSRSSIAYEDHVLRYVQGEWKMALSNEESAVLCGFMLYNMEMGNARAMELENRLLQIEKKSEEVEFKTEQDAIQWLEENAQGLKRYYVVRQNDSQIQIERAYEQIDEKTSDAGISLYLHNGAYKPEKMIGMIRGRDIVEKVFDMLKNEHQQNRLHTGKDMVAEGRIFLAFIALILRSILQRKVSESGINRSLEDILFHLRKIRAVHFSSGKRMLIEIPKKVRSILQSLKIDLPE